MDHATWTRMSETEKAKIRDLSGLTKQLIGLEGYRVEVTGLYGDTRRFIVGRSAGWRPRHIELSRRNSSGGICANREYKNVRVLYKAR